MRTKETNKSQKESQERQECIPEKSKKKRERDISQTEGGSGEREI